MATAAPPQARDSHTAVWTGSEMIIWGGQTNNSLLDSGGRYEPATDTWTFTNSSGAPSARENHTAVWTGTEMIVWGGDAAGFPSRTNTGGKYNPATNSWTSTSTTNAPDGRSLHTAVWTGNEMIVWGGIDDSFEDLNSGVIVAAIRQFAAQFREDLARPVGFPLGGGLIAGDRFGGFLLEKC